MLQAKDISITFTHGQSLLKTKKMSIEAVKRCIALEASIPFSCLTSVADKRAVINSCCVTWLKSTLIDLDLDVVIDATVSEMNRGIAKDLYTNWSYKLISLWAGSVLRGDVCLSLALQEVLSTSNDQYTVPPVGSHEIVSLRPFFSLHYQSFFILCNHFNLL
jgi:hypothetical protein